MSDIPALTDEQFESAIPARLRKKLIQGHFESGEDIAALRKFVGLTQKEFAHAMEISVHTLRLPYGSGLKTSISMAKRMGLRH